MLHNLYKLVSICSEASVCFNMFKKAYEERDDAFYFNVLFFAGIILGILIVKNIMK